VPLLAGWPRERDGGRSPESFSGGIHPIVRRSRLGSNDRGPSPERGAFRL